MEYNKKTTDWLAELMRRTAYPVRYNAKCRAEIGHVWHSGLSKTRVHDMLRDIMDALEEGADPNPIPGKSLFAVLCACPLEKSSRLIECVQTAVALGTNVKMPLVYDCTPSVERGGYSIIRSPVSSMFEYVSCEEAARRMDTIFSNMSDTDVRDIFCPRPEGGMNEIRIVEPLLCSFMNSDNFETLMRQVEKIGNPVVRKAVVNAETEIYDGPRVLTHQEAHVRGLRGQLDSTLRSRIGNTPMHECVTNLRTSKTVDVLRKLLKNGADLAVQNADGLTPYGVACTADRQDVLASDVFGTDPSSEFSRRDLFGRLLPTRVLDGLTLHDWDDRSVDTARTMLSEYMKCRNIEEKDGREITGVLSDAVAQVVARNVSNYNVLLFVEMLLGAGADPNYARPGRLPTWQNALMTHGDHPICRELIRAAGDMTPSQREWAALFMKDLESVTGNPTIENTKGDSADVEIQR